MKSTTGKRILSTLLSLVLLVGLLPAVAPPVQAAPGGNGVTVATWDELVRALEELTSDEVYRVTLRKDIKAEIGECTTVYDPLIRITQEKYLDLNGYEIIFSDKSNIWGGDTHVLTDAHSPYKDQSNHCLFEIKDNGSLTVTSSKEGGKIKYTGGMADRLCIDFYTVQRTVFKLNEGGTLVINGGTMEAGNTTKNYSASLCHNTTQIVAGYAVRMDGGTLVVNGGTLIGRGIEQDEDETVAYRHSTIRNDGGSIYINGGEIIGDDCANVFSNINGDVTIRGGTFKLDKVDYYRQEHHYNAIIDVSGFKGSLGSFNINKSWLSEQTKVNVHIKDSSVIQSGSVYEMIDFEGGPDYYTPNRNNAATKNVDALEFRCVTAELNVDDIECSQDGKQTFQSGTHFYRLKLNPDYIAYGPEELALRAPSKINYYCGPEEYQPEKFSIWKVNSMEYRQDGWEIDLTSFRGTDQRVPWESDIEWRVHVELYQYAWQDGKYQPVLVAADSYDQWTGPFELNCNYANMRTNSEPLYTLCYENGECTGHDYYVGTDMKFELNSLWDEYDLTDDSPFDRSILPDSLEAEGFEFDPDLCWIKLEYKYWREFYHKYDWAEMAREYDGTLNLKDYVDYYDDDEHYTFRVHMLLHIDDTNSSKWTSDEVTHYIHFIYETPTIPEGVVFATGAYVNSPIILGFNGDLREVRVNGTELSYQWYISDTGTVWTPIEGATASSYTPTSKDLGKYLQVQVQAEGYEGTVSTSPIQVTKNPYNAPPPEPVLASAGGPGVVYIMIQNYSSDQEYVYSRNWIDDSNFDQATKMNGSEVQLSQDQSGLYYVATRYKATGSKQASRCACASVATVSPGGYVAATKLWYPNTGVSAGTAATVYVEQGRTVTIPYTFYPSNATANLPDLVLAKSTVGTLSQNKSTKTITFTGKEVDSTYVQAKLDGVDWTNPQRSYQRLNLVVYNGNNPSYDVIPTYPYQYPTVSVVVGNQYTSPSPVDLGIDYAPNDMEKTVFKNIRWYFQESVNNYGGVRYTTVTDEATIDPKTGVITAKEAGEVTVTAFALKDEDAANADQNNQTQVTLPTHKYTMFFKAKVVENTAQIVQTGTMVTPGSITLQPYETYQLSAAALPVNADVSGKVSWSSANESIATVNPNGVVTAWGEGTTTITAKLNGYTAACIVQVLSTAHQHNGTWKSTGDAEHEQTCSVCGLTVTKKHTIERLDENYVPPTCSKDGVRQIKCTQCDYTGEMIVTTSGHILDGYISDPEGHTLVCTRPSFVPGVAACDYAEPKKAHSYQDGICTVCGYDMSDAGGMGGEGVPALVGHYSLSGSKLTPSITVQNFYDEGIILLTQYSSTGKMKFVQWIPYNGDGTVETPKPFTHVSGDKYQASLILPDTFMPVCPAVELTKAMG